MAFTPEQFSVLQWVARVSASLSVLGVLSIYVFFILNPKAARNPTARLIIFMATSDLLSASAKFLGRWPVEQGEDNALCQAQAALMQEGDLSSLTWTAILASNLLLVVFFRGRTDTIRKNELPLALFAYGWPLIFSLGPLFIKGPRGKIYGDSTLWCWITSEYHEYEIGFFYAFLWAVFLFNLISYILVGRVIWTASKDLEQRGSTDNTLSRYRVAFARTALAYMTAFIIVWTPSNLNRFYNMSVGTPLFPLSLAQTLMSPMRGFVNFLAYFWIYRMQLAGKASLQSSNERSAGGGFRSRSGRTHPDTYVMMDRDRCQPPPGSNEMSTGQVAVTEHSEMRS
ncbi:hypothetical protein PhCBS80983_g01382 [Powellomyces hirtus]|uniref:G-protein coupled receptors family 2 profile 2 domain-containing protein n=1 Tax=Powellomyces hirtus TaxID=109895 RepID=A0A507EAL2_9FUNG|nr:hypothetical protein DFJ77DRAFT_515749 [Powellomyces hirtus]KAI8915273.1 hypothetical protein DFJ77DRAFT_510371 [Powellomyces hirtus]TPX61109.1 hypothetical protein PhCBS80983_g01382 [Powellomyces hirtus]